MSTLLLQANLEEESTQVKVWFENGNLSEDWEAQIENISEDEYNITLWDPEGNELWYEDQFKERGITKIEVLNIFKAEVNQ